MKNGLNSPLSIKAAELREARRAADKINHPQNIQDLIKARGEYYDSKFRERMGDEYLEILETSGIGRSYGISKAGDSLMFTGQDAAGRDHKFELPISEKILEKFDPDILLMLIDKYLLRGFPVPQPNPETGVTHFNYYLTELGPDIPDFSRS